MSLSHHRKRAELYFQYFLVVVYFCVPGKGAHCFQMVSPIIDLCSALGEGLTWELTNSSYSANFLINWEKQWLPSELFQLFWVSFVWFGFFLPSALMCFSTLSWPGPALFCFWNWHYPTENCLLCGGFWPCSLTAREGVKLKSHPDF